MRGHIVQRSPNAGTWSIVIDLDKDASGKRRQKWLTFKGSSKEADAKLTEILHQLNTGTYVMPARTTLAEYLKSWIQDYAPNLTPRSAERYGSIIDLHLAPALGRVALTSLKPAAVQKHYTGLLASGLSPRSVRYVHVVLHKALQTALKLGLVARNVADGLDIPRARRPEMQTWNKDEMAAFLEAAKGTQYYALFYTALYTGMRRSELLALRWSDIDFIYSQISVTRTLHHVKGQYTFSQPKSEKGRRTIALPPSAFLVLEAYRKARDVEAALLNEKVNDDELVFSALGKPLRPNTVSRAWVMLAEKAGVKVIRFHDARHTHASIMLREGIHPKVVQERLGHASIAITLDTYSHVAPGLQDAAALRFDDAVKVRHNIEAGVPNSSQS